MTRLFICILIFITNTALVSATGLVVHRHNYFLYHLNVNPGKSSDALVVLSSVIGSQIFEGSNVSEQFNKLQDSVEEAINAPPLFYPSPFRLEDGSTLGYKLSKDMNVELRIYDMRGNEIYVDHYDSTHKGGQIGYNYVDFNKEVLGGVRLPAGPYFYLLFSDGDYIAKGKFVILP